MMDRVPVDVAMTIVVVIAVVVLRFAQRGLCRC